MTAPVLDTEKVGITRTLAEYLTGLEYDDIPADAVELLKIFTLEAVGHMVNAHAQPVSKMLVNYARELGAAPQASVIGSDLKTSVAEAAYVNGSLAHADELESYGTLPGTGLIPPIVAGLAAGEYRRQLRPGLHHRRGRGHRDAGTARHGRHRRLRPRLHGHLAGGGRRRRGHRRPAVRARREAAAERARHRAAARQRQHPRLRLDGARPRGGGAVPDRRFRRPARPPGLHQLRGLPRRGQLVGHAVRRRHRQAPLRRGQADRGARRPAVPAVLRRLAQGVRLLRPDPPDDLRHDRDHARERRRTRRHRVHRADRPAVGGPDRVLPRAGERGAGQVQHPPGRGRAAGRRHPRAAVHPCLHRRRRPGSPVRRRRAGGSRSR